MALRSCLEGHIDCPRETPTALPKRVLAFEKASATGNITVRLLCDSRKKGRYATLSHCWGLQQPCVTTQATLKLRTRGTPWAQLPPTFRDAIEFFLAVRVRYIWIDALCIVQENDLDWQVKSSKMADIYQNASCHVSRNKWRLGARRVLPEGGRPRANSFVKEQELRLLDSMDQWHGIRLREKVQHWTVPLSKAS